MMGKPKANKGRPSKYTYEDLKNLLLEYAKTNMIGRLTISGFAQHSGIPRSTLRHHKKIKEDIDKLNNQDIFSKKDIVYEIPSAEEFIKANAGKKLIPAITQLMNAYNHALEENIKIKDIEERNEQLIQEVNMLKEQKKSLLKTIQSYENDIKRMAIQSTSLKERNKNNIKENCIDLSAYSKTETTFLDLFDE